MKVYNIIVVALMAVLLYYSVTSAVGQYNIAKSEDESVRSYLNCWSMIPTLGPCWSKAQPNVPVMYTYDAPSWPFELYAYPGGGTLLLNVVVWSAIASVASIVLVCQLALYQIASVIDSVLSWLVSQLRKEVKRK